MHSQDHSFDRELGLLVRSVQDSDASSTLIEYAAAVGHREKTTAALAGTPDGCQYRLVSRSVIYRIEDREHHHAER